MIICNNCGVELEPDMEVCPLCETPVNQEVPVEGAGALQKRSAQKKTTYFETRNMSSPQRKAVWELVSIILILLIVATSLINYIINQEISWSEYPVAVCLIIFSYVSSFAFLNRKREIQLLCAFVSASILILALDTFTGGNNWALRLGIPLLFSTNIIFIGLLSVFRISRQRGINLIAYSFLAAALLCVCVETITDLYIFNHIRMAWSLIVCACVIPVAAVLLFMHYRMKKGRDLNKTFHI